MEKSCRYEEILKYIQYASDALKDNNIELFVEHIRVADTMTAVADFNGSITFEEAKEARAQMSFVWRVFFISLQ